MTKLKNNSKTCNTTSSQSELVIATQEKVRAREEFELSRQRLMRVTLRVQNLKAIVYFGEEVSHV